jgi:RHS repeat-associated protein
VYNANGELQSQSVNGNVTNYGFDSLGNLKNVTLPGGKSIEYLLDAQSRRVGKKVNGALTAQYVYGSQNQIMAVLDGNGQYKGKFVYGEKMNSPDYAIIGGVKYRIVSDQVGTPEMLIEAKTGTVAEQDDYDEFGNNLSGGTSMIPFGFAGGLYDTDTGLVHFGARDYNPVTGLWIQRDPIGFGGGQANLYSYSFSDPVNFVDPTGLDAQIPTPPGNVPGGPYNPAGPGQRPGTFFGPAQSNGPRPILRFVPPASQGGPAGSVGYWKYKLPGQNGWTRLNSEGQYISPDQAHPGNCPPTNGAPAETSVPSTVPTGIWIQRPTVNSGGVEIEFPTLWPF